MPSERHEYFVAEFLAEFEGSRSHGFGAAIAQVCAGDGEDPASLEIAPRPDVYLIDKARQAVICWEMAEANPLDQRRLANYEDLAWVLDDHGWSLMLMEVDCRMGGSHRIFPLEESLKRLAAIGAARRVASGSLAARQNGD